MSIEYAILPCNGLDKCAGCMSREVALSVANATNSDIICPVFYRVTDAKYNKLAAEKPLLVIDGCGTRCASKLAAEKNIKISERVLITDEAKAAGQTLPSDLVIGEAEKALINNICSRLTAEKSSDEKGELMDFPKSLEYETYQKDKFIFRIPVDPKFVFNENDVWAYVVGNKARVGVTDYVQQSLSDIMFFTPPTVGMEIQQFEALGDVESGKAVFEIPSPVTGMVTAVNDALSSAPELINANPYEQGWMVEVELADIEEDRELLHDFSGYFPVLKKKVDEFHI